ncbi:MAG: hypothetical protein PF436_05045 [Prolixibacteraceae bacterium]|jgi:hypothetical protein|nr:hypothetical protein [Prolixibacteraceae bacterium]
MKTTKLIKCALCAAIFALLGLVGCEQLDPYSIDAPSDLQSRIDSIANISVREKEIADSIAAAEAAAMEARLIDDVYQIGATDNSTGWWGGLSKYYRSENNADTIYVKFKNFTSGNNVWCNWVQAITNDVPRGGDGYVEYAIWRADNYSNFAWGTENGEGWNTSNEGDTHGQQQTTNYDDMATDNDDYTEYINLMNGADCVAQITRGGDSIYVDVDMTALSGRKLTKSFYIIEDGIKDQPIRVFWTLENCHIVFYKTLNPPLEEFIPDFELDENWDSGDVEEIEEEEPEVTGGLTYRTDMTATITTTDEEVFTYTYFVEGLPYGGYGSFLIIESGHMVIDPADTYYCALADTLNDVAWYYPYTEEAIIGLEDNTTLWWTAFSNYTSVIGEGYFHYKFVNHSSGLENWHNWVIALTNGHVRESNSYKECFVLRADAYGWGDYYVGDNIVNNYNWDNFLTDMNGSTVEISLKISAETSPDLKSAMVSKALKPGETIK